MGRKITYKSWTRTVVCSLILLVGSVVLINIIVDAYGILRTDFSFQFQLPNMNFIKIKYLLHHKNKFDSFIFGSSRVENIDQSKISGGRYYNMIYPLGIPQEHLRNIRFLLNNGVSVKNIMIGIDEFSYQLDPEPRRADLLTQPYPAISGKKPQVFYGEYFVKLRRTFSQLGKYIRYNYTRRNDPAEVHYIYDIDGSGRIFCPSCDETIERSAKKRGRNGFTQAIMHFDGNKISDTIDAMREIVSLAKQNNIKLTIFVNPMHKAAYLDTNLLKLALFKKELARIADYFDFSGLNSITTDSYYYYKPLHYRPLVGDMMLKVMFGAPNVAVPRDFGFLVTRGNVDAHLESQCLEIKRHRPELVLNEANTKFTDSCGALDDASRNFLHQPVN